MKSSSSMAATLFCLALGTLGRVELSFAEVSVKVGDEAPDFELSDSNGRVYKLSEFRAKNPVVLEFFRSGGW